MDKPTKEPESVGLGVRQTNLIKFNPPAVVQVVEDGVSLNLTPMQAGIPGDLTHHGREKDPSAACEGLVDKQVDEILNAIRAPYEWEEDSRLWRQSISNVPATRQDIIHLQEQLEFLLKKKQARRDGLCEIRKELYEQCFDELIRQIALNSPERGLLLLRVREEIKMTMAAFHSLHETASAFGIKKADEFEQMKEEPTEKVIKLRQEKAELERTVRQLRAELMHIEHSFVDKRLVDDKRHWEAMQFKKKANQVLKQHLEHILAPVTADEEDK